MKSQKLKFKQCSRYNHVTGQPLHFFVLFITVNPANGKKITDKVTDYNHVVKQMTGNIHFPTPDPTLSNASTAIKAMNDAYEAAIGGGTLLKVAMRAKEKACDAIMMLLLAYVQFTSKGDSDIILSSGFNVKRGTGSAGPTINIPSDVRVKPIGKTGISGQPVLLWKAPTTGPKPVAYEVQRCADPITDGGWGAEQTVTAAKCNVNPLAVGSIWWFRIRSLGIRNRASGWTSPVMIVVV